jgi:hypothetical protein
MVDGLWFMVDGNRSGGVLEYPDGNGGRSEATVSGGVKLV